jgi:hypothetical protein
MSASKVAILLRKMSERPVQGCRAFEIRERRAGRNGMAACFRLNADGRLALEGRLLGHRGWLSYRGVQLISAERDGHDASHERCRVVCEE